MKLAPSSFLMNGLPVVLFLSPLAFYPVDGCRGEHLKTEAPNSYKLGPEINLLALQLGTKHTAGRRCPRVFMLPM